MMALIGLGVALSLVVWMISTSGVPTDVLVDYKIIAFVVFGSLGGVVMRSSARNLWGMFRSVGKLIYYPQPSTIELVKTLVELGGINRRDGAIAMQNAVISHPFLRKSIDMVIDGIESTELRNTLVTEISLTRQRERIHIDMLRFWAELAPAFGMIGTMIGLIGMMTNMDDIKGIGEQFAVALLTTFWGMVLAYVVCRPWAEKLEGYSASDVDIYQLILEGAILIKDGANPRIIEERLTGRLAPDTRAQISDNASAN